jgi:hypothetical protein
MPTVPQVTVAQGSHASRLLGGPLLSHPSRMGWMAMPNRWGTGHDSLHGVGDEAPQVRYARLTDLLKCLVREVDNLFGGGLRDVV